MCECITRRRVLTGQRGLYHKVAANSCLKPGVRVNYCDGGSSRAVLYITFIKFIQYLLKTKVCNEVNCEILLFDLPESLPGDMCDISLNFRLSETKWKQVFIKLKIFHLFTLTLIKIIGIKYCKALYIIRSTYKYFNRYITNIFTIKATKALKKIREV